MTGSISLIILLAFTSQASNTRKPSRTTRLFDKLLDRALKVWPAHRADLPVDDTALGKTVDGTALGKTVKTVKSVKTARPGRLVIPNILNLHRAIPRVIPNIFRAQQSNVLLPTLDRTTDLRKTERALLPSLVKNKPISYVLKEKMLSLSGEDFNVCDSDGNIVVQIDSRNISLGGWNGDKLYLKDANGDVFCSVERRILAASTCYDMYSADGKQLLAMIQRQWDPLTEKYQFHYEGDMNLPEFQVEGSFVDQAYTFKARSGDTIARVRRGTTYIKNMDTYEVDVAAGVDAAAILACAVIIDEDHDRR